MAPRNTRHEVGSCWSYHDDVGALSQADMLHTGNVVEYLGVDRMPTQRFPRRASDEFEGSPSGNNVDLMAGFGEEPQEQACLVGGYPSPDTENDDTHVGPRSGVWISEVSEGIIQLNGRGLLGSSGLGGDFLGIHFMGLDDARLDLAHGDGERLLLVGGFHQRADILQ